MCSESRNLTGTPVHTKVGVPRKNAAYEWKIFDGSPRHSGGYREVASGLCRTANPPRAALQFLSYELVIYDGSRQQARFSANDVAFFRSVLLI